MACLLKPLLTLPARSCFAWPNPRTLPLLIPQVVSEFIRSPDMFQFDLAANPAVAQLGSSGSSEHRSLHRLLTIFLTGTVQVCVCAYGSAGWPAVVRGWPGAQA